MRYLAMINVVAVCLVLSTLAAAGVWSPAPSPPAPAATQHGEQVLREGRRVVIVEYERELPLSPGVDGAVKETQVLPPHALDGIEAKGRGVSDEAGEVLSDATGRVAGAAEDDKEKLSNAKESATGKVFGAVKRCKDRLCGAAKGAEKGVKDGASRARHGAEDAVRAAGETLSGAKETAEDKVFDAASEAKESARRAREKVSEAAGEAMEKASHVKDGAAETAKSAARKVSEAAGGAKEKASQVKDEAAETVRGAKSKVSEEAKNAKESAKETAMDAKGKVSGMAGRAEEYAQDAAEIAVEKVAQAEEVAKAKAGEVTKNLSDIARRARDVVSDAAVYLLGAPMEAARTATAVMHLLGFATAYGACVWVTFVSSHVLAAALPRQQLGIVQSKLYPVYFRAVAYGVGLALAAHLLGRERSSLAARAQSFNLLGALALVLANMLLLEPKATKVMFDRMKVEKEEGRGRDMADIVDTPVVTVATTAPPTLPATRMATTAATTTPSTATTAAARTPVDDLGPAKAMTTSAAADAEMAKSRVVRLNRRLKQLNGYSSLCNVLALMALTWHLVHLARRLQVVSAAAAAAAAAC